MQLHFITSSLVSFACDLRPLITPLARSDTSRPYVCWILFMLTLIISKSLSSGNIRLDVLLVMTSHSFWYSAFTKSGNNFSNFTFCNEITGRLDRMSHRKGRETKQQPIVLGIEGIHHNNG